MADTKIADAAAERANHDANVAKEKAAVTEEAASQARVEEVKNEGIAKEKIARAQAEEREKERESI
jgi:hypothetical protein